MVSADIPIVSLVSLYPPTNCETLHPLKQPFEPFKDTFESTVGKSQTNATNCETLHPLEQRFEDTFEKPKMADIPNVPL